MNVIALKQEVKRKTEVVKVEDLREELHLYIDLYYISDPKTIALSQELDKHIVKAMKEKKSNEPQ